MNVKATEREAEIAATMEEVFDTAGKKGTEIAALKANIKEGDKQIAALNAKTAEQVAEITALKTTNANVVAAVSGTMAAPAAVISTMNATAASYVGFKFDNATLKIAAREWRADKVMTKAKYGHISG